MVMLSLPLLSGHKWLFLLSELGIIGSIFISIRIYHSFIRPVNLISAGVESMQDRDFSIHFSKVGHFEMDQLIDVYNKMLDQLRMERIRHQEQHFFLEKLILSSPTGIVIMDYDGRIVSLNPAALRFFERTENNLVGKRLSDISGLPARKLLQLDEGSSEILRNTGTRSYKCRKSYFIDLGFKRSYYQIEELTEEVISTERRAYSQVIRLMSHEINNSVGAVNSILQSFLNQPKNNPLTRQETDEALETAIHRNERLNQFIANFADVVRIPPPQIGQHDLVPIVRNVVTLLCGECTQRQITVDTSELPHVCIQSFDQVQIEQVLVNLMRNAIEAIDHDGTIQIKLIGGSNPKLIIRDDGIGLSEKVQEQIFLPFFSTKKEGQGIGLTLVREILMNHRFKFGLESDQSGYTDFTIWF